MSILNNNKKYEITLSAIAVNDKLNKDHKACGISFTNNKEIYLPLCGCGNMPVLHRRLLELLSNQKEAINVNINSFLKLANPDHQQTIVNSFFTIDDFLTNKYSLKTTKSKRIEHNFIIDAIKYANLIKIAKVITEAENLSKTLMVMPSNYLTVDEFERIVKNKFQGLKNIKFSVLHKSELTKKKMGLILAVGKASPKVNEPRIIVVEYNNTPSKKKIALVGKGIIFDTGGLHLKPGESMTGMHGDMSGAALTLASIYAMAKLNINANVVGVAALATNEISADAYRVNDVITSYSGKTVEILNTDAEGRLALADGIAYAKRDLKANTIMTVATLTGAICIALGETYTGIWTSNDALWSSVSEASILAGESLWRMPFHYEYQNAIVNNTKIADLANITSTRFAGSNTAAEFLHVFADGTNFIHADIAGSNEYHKEFIPILVKTMLYLTKNFK